MITGDLGLYGERLAVVLGFITLALFTGMAVTCRSFIPFSNKIGLGSITRSKVYRSLFRFHSFFWFGFGVILFLHGLTGFMHTEIPQAGDPDAPVHLAILVFATGLFLSVGLTFSNCRAFSGMLRFFRGGDILTGIYGRFYRLHSYFWVLLLVALAGHLTASYLHIGFWPTQIE